jgi:hypothetical protein
MKENHDLNSKIKYPKTAIQETRISPRTNFPKFQKISIQLGSGKSLDISPKISETKFKEVNNNGT